jgi:aminoglycoside phosphotransferase (APT) family kinase protein
MELTIMNKQNITKSFASKLINEQFPQWENLPIKEVAIQGWDNRTFHLGNDMLIRLPSTATYALQVEKEQTWLPKLAPHITLHIPKPIEMGKPTDEYPWHWSIYQWLPGTSANMVQCDETNLAIIAKKLANFLHELHTIKTTNAPEPGKHNFFRGGDLAIYDEETKTALATLKDIIDIKKTSEVWQQALTSTWHKKPIWIHGDMSLDNILLNNDKQITAIIDFGLMAVGDPACDLTIAWTLLKNENRMIFKSAVNLDENTWQRARGWALWKALITLVAIDNKNSNKAKEQLRIINDIIYEHSIQNRIKQCAQLWQLKHIKAYDNLSHNWTAKAYSTKNKKNVVLKICTNKNIFQKEKNALQYFNHNSSVKLLAFSDLYNALLLEQIKPGTPLKKLFPEHDQLATQYAADLIQKMHPKPIENNHTFATVTQWLKRLSTCKHKEIQQHHLDKAQAIAQKLLKIQNKQYVLHGDLHHDNILQDATSWKAIDPQGVIGELAYEVGAYMRNPIPELYQHKDIAKIIEQRLETFARLLNIDKQRIAKWSYVQAVLAACWAAEDNLDVTPFIAHAETIAYFIQEFGS